MCISGAIGWVAMIAIGSLYAMAPQRAGSTGDAFAPRDEAALLAAHDGLLLYVACRCGRPASPQALMWRATNPDGSLDLQLPVQPDRDPALLRGALPRRLLVL